MGGLTRDTKRGTEPLPTHAGGEQLFDQLLLTLVKVAALMTDRRERLKHGIEVALRGARRVFGGDGRRGGPNRGSALL